MVWVQLHRDEIEAPRCRTAETREKKMEQPQAEIIDDQACAEDWLRREDGGNDEPRKDRVNHASKIGHPCDRYLVLRRTHGDKAAPPSFRLRAIFKRGRVLEQPIAVQQLIRHGWRVWDEQRTFDIIEKGEVILSARIDCLGKPPGSERTYVIDHKIVNPHDWGKIPRGWDGYDFLRNSSKPWLRAWPAQVQSYMYAHPGSAEVGLLQLVNAETLLPKFVYVPFDVEYMQWIIDRSLMVNARTKAVLLSGMKELPPPIDWDETVCGRCEMLGTCLPDQLGRTPLELIEDDSFVELVAEDRELSKQKGEIEKRYKLIHDRVKHMVGDRREVAAGPYWITQKEIAVKEYVVAARTQMRMDIKEIAPKQADRSAEEVA